MNTHLTELNTAQSRQEYIDADDCSSKEDNNVNPGPAGTPLWTGPPSDVSLPGVAPHHHQYIIQPGMVDPLSLRFPYPCQSTHCQLNYPDYLLEPQSSQYHLLTDPVPGPPDRSLHSSGSAHWFTNEPILCSMMPGDLHAPVSSICVPQAVDHQQFQEGLTEFTSHIPQHVMCNVSGGGQVVLVNPCEPGPVFLTLKSAPTHTDDGPTAGEGEDYFTKSFRLCGNPWSLSQKQVVELAAENKVLKGSVKSLTEGMTRLSADNKNIREAIIDLQARSMRDNLVISGIPEQADEAPQTVKSFIQNQLKLPAETVKNISFHRVHRLGGRRQENQRPRPIVAKFEHFKQKELVKGRGRELRGTNFSINDHFPREILDRRRVLFPIRKRLIGEGSRAVIAVDKLYVDGQLYRDRDTTPWLY
ncbi:uncharacterized protein LOC123966398 [Micropterus dolomieu]|uniref:uncharacterized protein LOC123966398 n=1 Tax=Micropterus dolomieu TaxID=147949 RepID=UPI001E8E2282|nr:uncharacterized protein LOC123966398 [Micropterus dolomieu]